MTEIHKERMRATLKKRWQDPTFRAEAIRRMHSVPYVTHHVDLDKTNNVGSNRLKVTASGHNSIHRQSYRYLVETGQILNYVEWFKIKFPEHLYDESRSRDPE
jgi:hypothetical protein